MNLALFGDRGSYLVAVHLFYLFAFRYSRYYWLHVVVVQRQYLFRTIALLIFARYSVSEFFSNIFILCCIYCCVGLTFVLVDEFSLEYNGDSKWFFVYGTVIFPRCSLSFVNFEGILLFISGIIFFDLGISDLLLFSVFLLLFS